MKRKLSQGKRSVTWAALGAIAVIFASAGYCAAAEFSVSPMRMDLGQQGRSAALRVANQDAHPLHIQLRLAEWSQDASGVDVYREAPDMNALPGQMTLGPGESRVVNVGFSPAADRSERAYRLFLNEIPQAGRAGNFALSFALPVFVAPADPEPRAEILQAALAEGKLRITVANPGNQHVRIESLGASAGTVFNKEIGGWYLLAGAQRVHILPIPASACGSLGRLDIKVRTEKGLLEKSIGVEPGMCAR